MPNQSFYEEVQDLNACRVFARTLPWICARYGMGVSFRFVGRPDGVEIDLAMTEGGNEEISAQTVRFLKMTERLMWIESLLHEFKRIGAPAEEINALVEEGESLAQQLHPEDYVPSTEEAVNG